jgi:hypothetical protein
MHKMSVRARILAGVVILSVAGLLAVVPVQSAGASGSPNVGFGFNASNISGFPTGSVALTGGGALNPDTSRGFAHAGGSFTCTSPVDQNQPPFGGCQQGEGVRWDTEKVLAGTLFKCAASDTARSISTGDDTVVLHADFYRAGDGNEESFTANMIVSTHDLDGDPNDGVVQNVWVQGIGCGTALTQFS